MIVYFKINDKYYQYNDDNLASIIVGEHIVSPWDFEITMNEFDGNIGDVLNKCVYINNRQYVVTDIHMTQDSSGTEYVISGVTLGDFILSISVAKTDYVYNDEDGEQFLTRILWDTHPDVRIDGRYYSISLQRDSLPPLDLAPPKKGDRISEWLIEQLEKLRYTYHFEKDQYGDPLLVIGYQRPTSKAPHIFTSCFNIEKSKGDFWDSFWYTSTPTVFLKKTEYAEAPFSEIRDGKRPYHTVSSGAPELVDALNRIFTIDQGQGYFATFRYDYNDSYALFLEIVRKSGGTDYTHMYFDEKFIIPDFDDEYALQNMVSDSGGVFIDDPPYSEVRKESYRMGWAEDQTEHAISGTWWINMRPSPPTGGNHGFILKQGNKADINTDTFQTPDGLAFFEGLGLMTNLFSEEKTVSQMEVADKDFNAVNLLDRVCFGIEGLNHPQVCTDKVITKEKGEYHYDVQFDDLREAE